jgi:hypothetical protein
LGRGVTVVLGVLLLAAGAYTLFLQLTSGEPMRSFIVGMGILLLVLGVYALWTGLRPRR